MNFKSVIANSGTCSNEKKTSGCTIAKAVGISIESSEFVRNLSLVDVISYIDHTENVHI